MKEFTTEEKIILISFTEPTKKSLASSDKILIFFRKRYAIFLDLLERKSKGEDVDKSIEAGKVVLRQYAEKLIDIYEIAQEEKRKLKKV